MKYEPVIGLEVHAELQTESKMFCSCPVVDPTLSEPNTAVCPVCTGMPGVLPVANHRAVEYAIRVALALECEVANTSIFARKNYFYPDLPKGYQISQYEQPLARNGKLSIQTSSGEKVIRIRRVHLEEDTGKLTHVNREGEEYSLVDLNRAGVPLLEIVTEPDLRSAEEVRAYASALRTLLRYLEVNSGDMEKGVMRIEPNISVRLKGSQTFGTRTEVKNLNSFRALERAVDYEISRQINLLEQGQIIRQETVGWDENREVTFTQRVKEGEEDYRYFPEPDLPPLVTDPSWIEQIRTALPELPGVRRDRFQKEYGLNQYDADVLVAEKAVADYYEEVLAVTRGASPKLVANWVTGELFSILNQANLRIEASQVTPSMLAGLLILITSGEINNNTAKSVLAEMFSTGKPAAEVVTEQGWTQISDREQIADRIAQVLMENEEQVRAYIEGKESIARWLFGQVMQSLQGKGNPTIVQQELNRQLEEKRKTARL